MWKSKKFIHIHLNLKDGLQWNSQPAKQADTRWSADIIYRM